MTAVVGAHAANPILAEGVQLIGEYEGSGFKEPPSLVRRGDGQVIQLPTLLYLIAEKADGTRSYDDLSREVGAEIKRGLDGEQVRYLADEKLRPLGILAAADGSSPPVEKPDPFLALKFRVGVISERMSGALGTLFKPLFVGPLILVVLGLFVAADVWLFLHHGVAQAVRQSIQHPGLFLVLFLAVIAAAAFHEIGHAAACRYGGGDPGRMGCGLYLAWPAFYTDVTDAYRLGRRARLRTDLGGVYFNVVLVIGTIGLYFATGWEPLLLLAVIQHFEIAHQLLPVVRLDGYYIVSDLTGVPDLFARIGPILRSMIPGRTPDEKVTCLKRWVRVAVTAWVLVVVPLLLFELLIVLVHLPRMLATAWDSTTGLWHATTAAGHHGDVLLAATNVIQIVVLAIPIVGILLVLVRGGAGMARWMWRGTEGKPLLRAGGLLLTGVALYVLAMAWIPGKNYVPIRPGERGTLAEGAAAVRHISTTGPRYSEVQAEKRDAVTTENGAPASATSSESPTTTSTSVAESTTSTSSTSTSTTSTTVHRTTTTTSPTTTTSTSPTTTSTTTSTTAP